MSANIINMQFGFGSVAEATGYNRIQSSDTFPLALDDEDSTASTFTIDLTTAFDGYVNNGYGGGDKNGIPALVLKGMWFTSSTTVGQVSIGGTIPAGKQIKQITVLGSAPQNDGSRLTDVTIGGVTKQYDARDFAAATPIIFTTGLSSLPITIDIEKDGTATNGYFSAAIIELEAVVTGPTLTGPASTTEQAATVAAGTDLDDVTIFSLISGTFSIEQTIDSATATTLNYVAESGVNLCTPSTPVAGVPLEATISAAGVTPYQIQQEADDEVNTPATFNITLNGEATHEVVQVMIGTSNTTPGESVLATTIIAVENNMQYHAPKVVDTVNITWAADGTFTTDKDQTIIVPIEFISPSTKQWSCIVLTIKDTSIISVGGILRDILRSPLKDILRSPIK